MPTFNFTGPDGKTYSVEGPEGSTPEQAFQVLQSQISAAPKSDAPKPDKYQQAAIEERDALKAKGVDTSSGLTRRLVQGATFNLADEALAGAMTPLEMIKRGTFSPREGYNYAKAREDLNLEDARKNTGVAGTVAEIAGGVGTGLGAAAAGAGLTFARNLAPNAGLLSRSLASAGDSAAFGALAGGGEGNSIGERFNSALLGGGLGGLLGAAAPGAVSLLGQAASPILSNIKARLNPEGFARGQVARAIQESGVSPNDLSLNMVQAANEGQGAYTLADAMGNAGQRMLSTVARAPGEGRTAVVNALEGRQADQGRRVAAALSEGFDATQTAAQRRIAMETARSATADAEYGAARAGAGQVNVVPAINNIDRTIGTGPGQALQAANDSIEGALRPFRERLARVNPDDFEAVQRIRSDMADMAQNARQQGYGNRARLIGNAVRELDASMEAASPGYQQANRNFAQASRNIDQIAEGRTAATRGRPEDTIPTFQRLTPEGQQAFRTGYADPLIEQAQGAAYGANKARPLTSDAFRDEAAAMAPGNAMMQRRLGREMTMFETRNQALGGSRTADNLADAEALGVNPTLVTQVLSGNWSGALRSTLAAGQNALTGNTAQVRQAVSDILLQRGANMSPAALQRMVDETTRKIQQVQQMARSLGRGAAGGLAVATPAQNRR